jgi:anti-anti-sigma factor
MIVAMKSFEVEPMEDPRGLRLKGELDLAAIPDVDSPLRSLVEEGGDITLDVSELRFMDSSAVQLVIRAVQGLDRRGRVILDQPVATVRRLIEVMGLDRFENLVIRE